MGVRQAGVVLAIAGMAAACASSRAGLASRAVETAGETCPARRGPVTWLSPRVADRAAIDRWCLAVGAPVVIDRAPLAAAAPDLADLTVVTWNAHLGAGRLAELVADLRAGALTGGRPVRHFVLLVQELFRRGEEVPGLVAAARSAAAIGDRPNALDAREVAEGLDLSLVYVPSMRNGAERREDRGNALLSTEPLVNPVAFELPFERQRRVAVGATVHVTTDAGLAALHLMNVHFDPVSGFDGLWIFRNPRGPQLAAVFDALPALSAGLWPASAGTVLGGDFNTVQGGAAEPVYAAARAWSTGLSDEDPRGTHLMGRLDFLFFRLEPGWQATSRRAVSRFGSDHHPVIGRFTGVSDLAP
jgi:endonuclease/exonuclease/phosphatase family metal-dependent hydrolase